MLRCKDCGRTFGVREVERIGVEGHHLSLGWCRQCKEDYPETQGITLVRLNDGGDLFKDGTRAVSGHVHGCRFGVVRRRAGEVLTVEFDDGEVVTDDLCQFEPRMGTGEGGGTADTGGIP